jgi:hypothetical protein
MSSTYSITLGAVAPAIPERTRSEKPIMALSGVRSSWLIPARNSLFARFAVSAVTSASRRRRSERIASVTSRPLPR